MGIIMIALLRAAALPTLWAEPADPGRAVTRDDAIGLCASDDRSAIREAGVVIGAGVPGNCQALQGLWRVSRRLADRCIGTEPGQTMDDHGQLHPAISCRAEAHVVEIRQDDAVRMALIMSGPDQQD